MIIVDSTSVPFKEMYSMAKQFANYYGQLGIFDPEDICQTAMLALVKQKPYPRRPLDWLRKVIRNEAMNACRKQSQDRRYLVDCGDLLTVPAVSENSPHPYEHFIADTKNETVEPDTSKQLDLALSQIPQPMRHVLLLYAQGYNYEEIARITNSKVGTVRSRLFHARLLIRPLVSDLA